MGEKNHLKQILVKTTKTASNILYANRKINIFLKSHTHANKSSFSFKLSLNVHSSSKTLI